MKRVHYQEGKFALGSILCALIPDDEEKLNARFLYNYLSFFKESLLVPLMRGAANVSLSIKSIASVEIPLPPLDEQLAINKLANSFSLKTNTLRSELQTQQKLLTQLRQAILQEAVHGKLTERWRMENVRVLGSDPSRITAQQPETGADLLTRIRAEKAELIRQGKLRKEKPLSPITDAEKPFELPEGWVWCRLGEVELLADYGTSQRADLNTNNIPVLRMGNIQNGKVIYNDLKYVSPDIDDLPKLYLQTGDLLFNRTNSFELVGKAGIFSIENASFTFASYLIRIRLMDEINPYYINSWINTEVCRKTQIEPNTIQQNGQANFNGSKLKNILIPLPPLAEQQAIVAQVEQLLGQVSELEVENKQQRAEVGRLMQAVLREAFAGKEVTTDELA